MEWLSRKEEDFVKEFIVLLKKYDLILDVTAIYNGYEGYVGDEILIMCKKTDIESDVWIDEQKWKIIEDYQFIY